MIIMRTWNPNSYLCHNLPHEFESCRRKSPYRTSYHNFNFNERPKVFAVTANFVPQCRLKPPALIVFTVFAAGSDHAARLQEFSFFYSGGGLWAAWLLRLSLLMWAQELMARYNRKKRRFRHNWGSKLSPLARYIALGQPRVVVDFLECKLMLQQLWNLLFFKSEVIPTKKKESNRYKPLNKHPYKYTAEGK